MALKFQELANVASFFPVTCRFRKVIRTRRIEILEEGKKEPYTHVDHEFWVKGAEEFKRYFGPAANYFAGALEYIQQTTGWKYPYHSLDVMVFNTKERTSAGFALYPPGLTGNPNGSEARIFWADGEFTLTVLHELIHLFKKTKVLPPPNEYEKWVEQQALILTVGI